MNEQNNAITVGELIDQLKIFNKDDPIDFSGLDFYRLKDRSGVVQVEFNQSVYKDSNGNVVVENHWLII